MRVRGSHFVCAEIKEVLSNVQSSGNGIGRLGLEGKQAFERQEVSLPTDRFVRPERFVPRFRQVEVTLE